MRQPTVHGALLAFIQEDDVWLQKNWQDIDKPAAQRLTTDGCASSPVFSPDGTRSVVRLQTLTACFLGAAGQMLAYSSLYTGDKEAWVMPAEVLPGASCPGLTRFSQLILLSRCRVAAPSRSPAVAMRQWLAGVR